MKKIFLIFLILLAHDVFSQLQVGLISKYGLSNEFVPRYSIIAEKLVEFAYPTVSYQIGLTMGTKVTSEKTLNLEVLFSRNSFTSRRYQGALYDYTLRSLYYLQVPIVINHDFSHYLGMRIGAVNSFFVYSYLYNPERTHKYTVDAIIGLYTHIGDATLLGIDFQSNLSPSIVTSVIDDIMYRKEYFYSIMLSANYRLRTFSKKE